MLDPEETASAPGGPAQSPHLGAFAPLFPVIFANSFDAILLTSTDGAIHAANPAACRLFGRSEEEIRKLGRAGVMDPTDPRVAAAVEERRRVGYARSEMRALLPDGTTRHVEVSSALLVPGTDPSPAVIICRDMTDRVRTEEALRSERLLLERVFASLDDAVFVIDLPTRHIVRVNRAAERLLGMASAEMMGRDTSFLYADAEQFRSVGARAAESFAACGFFESEETVLGSDRQPIPVHYFSRPVEEGGAGVVVSVVRDLRPARRSESERDQLQAALFQTRKMESLGVLAGGVAHEFNNLLATVLASADSIARAIPPGSGAAEPLADVVAAAQRGADLVRHLLAFVGKGSGAEQVFDLSAAVRDVTHVAPLSVSKQIRLDFRLPPALILVRGDPAQIRRAVVNLVRNAGEAIGDHPGHVSVSTGKEDLSAGDPALVRTQPPIAPGSYAWVEVADDGPGMTADVAGRVFDPFFSTRAPGRGLGLPAVAGTARAHGGGVEVETAPGRGARFRVWLPLAGASPAARPEPAPTPAPAAAAAPGAGATILVVDDEPLVRKSARRVLEAAGFRVLEAADGVEALELFRARAAEVGAVLLDFAMPRMGGEETLQALRKMRPDLPVVLCSGYGDEEAMARLRKVGLAGELAKPYRPKELVAMLRVALVAGAPK